MELCPDSFELNFTKTFKNKYMVALIIPMLLNPGSIAQHKYNGRAARQFKGDPGRYTNINLACN
jgi:hypothetical protein